MRIRVFVLLSLALSIEQINAQLPLLTEKPGTFEILSRTDYTSSECGFTKEEINSNLQNINNLINTVRKNPVLAENKGFDGRARIYNLDCTYSGGYGIPARISFEFAAWFRRKDGKEVRNLIEPPEWSLYINEMIPGWTGGFNSKRGYFTVPLRKKNVEKGVDIYDGECFVIYDPSRPSYWIPVTVEEAFDAVKEDLKNVDDPVAAQYMKEFIDREYAEIPMADHNKRAYFSGNLSRISSTPGFADQDSIFPFIMKVNPEYWNKSLPESAIQFIDFRAVTNKKYLKQLKEEYLQNNSTSYHVKRFEESFDIDDIRKLVPLVGK